MFCQPQGCPAGYDKNKCCCKKVEGGYALDCITSYKEECNICKGTDVASFTQNQCNQCSCNSDGTVGGCTKKFCPPQGCPADYDKNKCCCRTHKDGTQELDCVTELKPSQTECNLCKRTDVAAFKENQCNSCTCNSDGTVGACTLMACEPKGCPAGYDKNKCCCRTNKDGSQELDCVTKFKTDCNICKRTDVASFKQNQCNSCKCKSDGTVGACTLMACEPKGCPAGYDKNKCCCRTNKDGTQELDCVTQFKPPISDCNLCSKPNVRSIIQNQCNICSCKDGAPTSCTEKACDSLGCPPGYDTSRCCCRKTPKGKYELDCISNDCPDFCARPDVRTYKENMCNTCTCGKDGERACTDQACEPSGCSVAAGFDSEKCCCRFTSNGEEMDCITEFNCDYLCKGVKEVWWGCNSCKCVNGKVTDGCTKKFCPLVNLTCDSDYDPTQCCCREIKNADGTIQRRLICRDRF